MISSHTLQFFYYFVSWNELDYAEIIAEQLHNNADSITDKCKFLVFKPCENLQTLLIGAKHVDIVLSIIDIAWHGQVNVIVTNMDFIS